MQMERYWSYAESRKRPKTVSLERYAWRSYQNHGGTVDEWHRAIQLSASSSTANVYLRHLRAVYSGLQRLGMVHGNPAREVPQFSLPWRNPDFVSLHDFERFHAHCRGALYLRVALAFYAGLRKGEACHARWEWFDFESKILTVRCSHGFQTKSGAERSIPMSSTLLELLRPLAQRQGLLSHLGDPKSVFATARRRANQEHITWCILRHSFGSLYAQRGVPLIKISRWMGHSSVKVTEKYYVGLQSYDSDIERLK